MGKRALSGRDNWQEQGGAKASEAEKNLYAAFYEHFRGTEYVLHEKPREYPKVCVNLQTDVR